MLSLILEMKILRGGLNLVKGNICLDIKSFISGKCFICGNICSPEHYAHDYCCIAYDDEKKKRIKEANNEDK